MKHIALKFVTLIGMLLSGTLVYGQVSSGAGVKKPRTLEDYKPSTLKEILAGDSDMEKLLDHDTSIGNNGELVPFRVRVTFTASAKPISRISSNILNRWARCCAGNPDHYKAYASEMQFDENGTPYWLLVQTRSIADFKKELEVGEALDLFLIRISFRAPDGKRASVLLIERFQRDDQLKESLDWLRSNLPSYTEKDLKVEMPEPCKLKISETLKSASVSKAFVFIPLGDLDVSKMSVERHQTNDAWQLWLHTSTGKDSILFMLYQGGPAEGGQTNKYSLTFRDREKADETAEVFRRANKLCATPKIKLQ